LRLRHLDTIENRRCTEQAIETFADRTTGLLEHEIQRWENTGKQFQSLIVKQIRTTLEARIAQEQGKCLARTAGYYDDDTVLRREFGFDLEPVVSELTTGDPTDLRRLHGHWELPRNQGVDLEEVAKADTLFRARGTDLEDKEENCFITTL